MALRPGRRSSLARLSTCRRHRKRADIRAAARKDRGRRPCPPGLKMGGITRHCRGRPARQVGRAGTAPSRATTSIRRTWSGRRWQPWRRTRRGRKSLKNRWWRRVARKEAWTSSRCRARRLASRSGPRTSPIERVWIPGRHEANSNQTKISLMPQILKWLAKEKRKEPRRSRAQELANRSQMMPWFLRRAKLQRGKARRAASSP